MRGLLLCGLSLSMLLSACQKKDANGSSGAFPKPDESTFFPLLPGSYWVYRSSNPGDAYGSGTVVDSVLSLTQSDSGFYAVVRQTVDSSNVSLIKYRVDSKGMVWRKRENEKDFVAFIQLRNRDSSGAPNKPGECWGGTGAQPECAQTVLDESGDQPKPEANPKVNPQADPEAELEVDGETEDGDEAIEGIYDFRKGMGIEGYGIFETSYELNRYRIGSTGLIVKTGRGLSGDTLTCALPSTDDGECPCLAPDFDGDGKPDTLQLVRTGRTLPDQPMIIVQDPFGSSETSFPESLAVRIRLSGSSGSEFLLCDSAYFHSALWANPETGYDSLEGEAKGSKPFPDTDDETLPKALGDAVYFPRLPGPGKPNYMISKHGSGKQQTFDTAIVSSEMFLYYSKDGFKTYTREKARL